MRDEVDEADSNLIAAAQALVLPGGKAALEFAVNTANI